MTEGPTIAVGIDHTAESLTAAVWAARQTIRHHGRLVLAHSLISPTYVPTTDGEVEVLQELGSAVVEHTAQRIARLYPELPITTTVESSMPINMLTELSGTVDALILGRRRRNWLDRGRSVSISAEMSVRSGCPVITVPSQPEALRGPVVAVADLDEPRCTQVIARAFAYADEAEHPIVVLTQIDDDLTLDELARTYSRADSLVQPYRVQYPGLAVRVQLINGSRRYSLADAAPNASLLIVGKPRQTASRLAWRRSTARAIQRQARTPVAIV